jgi:Type IV pilin-like G and H, putative
MLFFRKYSNRAVGTVLAGILGLIVFNAFDPSQRQCKLQPEELQNSVVFLRSQAAYYRGNEEFAKDFDRLEMGLLTGTKQAETKYYHYQIDSLKRDMHHQDDRKTVILTAQPKDARLKTAIAYAVIPDRIALDSSDLKQSSVYMVVCHSDRAGVALPRDFSFIGTKIICPSGYTSNEVQSRT